MQISPPRGIPPQSASHALDIEKQAPSRSIQPQARNSSETIRQKQPTRHRIISQKMDSYPRITRRERRLVEPPLAATDRRGETGTLMGTNYREFYVGYPEQTTQPESSELSTKIREFISSMISFPNSKKRRSGVPSSSQLPRCVQNIGISPQDAVARQL